MLSLDERPGISDESAVGCRRDLAEPLSRGGIELYHTATRRYRVIPAGSELRRGADAPNEISLLLKGWACRYQLLPDGRRQILDIYLPGDLVGLDALLLAPSPDMIVALNELTLGSLSRDSFLQFMSAGNVALHAFAQLSAEKRRLDNHLAIVGQLQAEERIASLLVEFHERLRRRQVVRGKSFDFPLTQQQLGDFLGMTVVHVNRVLKRLRDNGIVNIKHRLVVIHDMAKLLALAAGHGTLAAAPVALTPRCDGATPVPVPPGEP